jgi:hypothetical protein
MAPPTEDDALAVPGSPAARAVTPIAAMASPTLKAALANMPSSASLASASTAPRSHPTSPPTSSPPLSPPTASFPRPPTAFPTTPAAPTAPSTAAHSSSLNTAVALSASSPTGSRSGSRAGSRAPSLLDAAGPSSAADEAMAALKCDVMVHWLHHQQEERRWTKGGPGEGVVLKRARGAYVCAPEALASEGDEIGDVAGEEWEGQGDRWDGRGFLAAVRGLNVRVSLPPFLRSAPLSNAPQVALTINTAPIHILLRHATARGAPFVALRPGLRVQVLPGVAALPRCRKHQFAAFVARPPRLVVWDDAPDAVVGRAEELEKALIAMAWGQEEAEEGEGDGGQEERGESGEEGDAVAGAQAEGEPAADEGGDVEAAVEAPRRIVLMQPVLSALTLALTVFAIGGGWKRVAVEIVVDGQFIRAAFMLGFLPQAWLALVGSSVWRRSH